LTGAGSFQALGGDGHTQVAMTDATAEEFKAQGNELYKRGDYQRAIDKYTQAIDAAPTVVAYYGNRAAASFMLGKHKDVITDCNRAIVFDPLYFTGYVRKAKAQLALVGSEWLKWQSLEVTIIIDTCVHFGRVTMTPP